MTSLRFRFTLCQFACFSRCFYTVFVLVYVRLVFDFASPSLSMLLEVNFFCCLRDTDLVDLLNALGGSLYSFLFLKVYLSRFFSPLPMKNLLASFSFSFPCWNPAETILRSQIPQVSGDIQTNHLTYLIFSLY